METKVSVLIVGIVMLLGGFILLLFLAPGNPALLFFGALAFVVGINVTFIGFVEIAADKEVLQRNRKKIIPPCVDDYRNRVDCAIFGLDCYHSKLGVLCNHR